VVSEGAPVASFEFRRGELAGSHLSLFDSRLVHRSAGHFEAMPLAHIGAVSVGFERDSGRIALGCVLLFIGVVLFASFWPLRALVGSALAELGPQAQGGGFLPAALRALDFCVALLPFASVAFVVWATACLALGWIGETVMRVLIAPSERAYAARGRDPELFEFAESLSAHIARHG
jgi:hypothetical protein